MNDLPTAWASHSQDAQQEWLELDYTPPVQTTAVHIYETYRPGALTRVTAFDAQRQEHEIWRGKDPAASGPDGIWVARIPLSLDFPVARIRLHLDSPAVAGWNEIDAVGLTDQSGQVHWAVDARASSAFGSSTGFTSTLQQLQGFAPAWCGLPMPVRPRGPFSNQTIKLEARGWPMLAVWGKSHPLQHGGVNPLHLYHPIWSDLFIDSVFWGTLLAVLYLLTFGLRRFVRESLRLRRGRCMKCGYDLAYNIAAGCPECGWRRT